MPRDALIRSMAQYELDHLKVLTRNMMILSTICAVVAASMLGIGVTLVINHNSVQDSIQRSIINCQIQRQGRIEGNKRVVYNKATKYIIESFDSTREFLKKVHPELYPLPDIKELPIPDCRELPGAGPNANELPG